MRFAKRAFHEQSEEVRTLADQLKVSREQFEEQKRLNARQTDVLDLQQQDLRESLEQRQLAQAALIYATNDYFSGRSRGNSEEIVAGRTARPPTVTATIYNASPQSIYDVRVMWVDARDLREVGDCDFLRAIRLIPWVAMRVESASTPLWPRRDRQRTATSGRRTPPETSRVRGRALGFDRAHSRALSDHSQLTMDALAWRGPAGMTPAAWACRAVARRRGGAPDERVRRGPGQPARRACPSRAGR